MRPLAILALALLLTLPTAAAGVVRTESKRYMAAPGDFTTDCGLVAGSRYELGGACFYTKNAKEARVRLSVDDDTVAHTAAIYVVSKNGEVVDQGSFCDQITLTLTTSPRTDIEVYIQQAFAPEVCPGAMPGTTGYIDAVYLTRS